MNQKEVWQPDFHQINPDFPSIYFHGTRDEVMRLIGRRSPQAREIESRIQMLERRTLWRAEIGERVVEIKERFGVLTAERFIENSEGLFEDPRFDFETYSNLFIRAHTMFGKKAGDYFALSYPQIVTTDKDPSRFFEYVGAAVASDGRLFASYYAYYLPEFWGAGGNPVNLRINASKVRQSGGIKLARSFMINAQ